MLKKFIPIYPDTEMNQISVKFKVSDFQNVDFVIRANVKEKDIAKVIHDWQKMNTFTSESLVNYINTRLGLGFQAEKFDYKRHHKITRKK